MQEPKIHSAINPFLPGGHWLEDHYSFNPETGYPNPLLRCRNCGRRIYDSVDGTIATWVETGFLFAEHLEEDGSPHVEAGVWDIGCFSAKEGDVTPILDPRYALNDDGSPQPYIEG